MDPNEKMEHDLLYFRLNYFLNIYKDEAEILIQLIYTLLILLHETRDAYCTFF